MNKTEAVNEYIKNYPSLYSWLYFNTILMESGSVSLITDADNLVTSYNDGAQEREYIFAINFMKEYDTGTSEINLEAISETTNFIDWVKDNTKNDIFPDFGNECTVNNLEVLNEIPLMSVDTDTSIARYMLQLKVEYFKEGDL